MQEAPRIYNLFPLLAGPVTKWQEHLPRIAGMGFNWIYVNPFHYPGFSGSLYAIKDFSRLHPRLQGTSKKSPDDLLLAFCKAAEKHGLQVMFDLVINHTGKDALLVDERPDWYVRDHDGSVHAPRTVDPLNPNNVTIWGDLGEIDYGNTGIREAQISYWQALIKRYLAMGCRGFRCDAAYQVPMDVWRPLIGDTKANRPDCRFFAETLGCSPQETMALQGAGFDFLFNSSKWWDFREFWLFDQYNQYRHLAPTVAFPESHDTDRLINELGTGDPAEVERHYRFRYLFSALFSGSVMTTMGFEYGFNRRLHVVHTKNEEWDQQYEARPFDLTGFITEVNKIKAASPSMNSEGEQRLVHGHDGPVIGLIKFDGPSAHEARGVLFSILNPDGWHAHGMDPGQLINHDAGRFAPFRELTPNGGSGPFEPGNWTPVEPLGIRVFEGRAGG